MNRDDLLKQATAVASDAIEHPDWCDTLLGDPCDCPALRVDGITAAIDVVAEAIAADIAGVAADYRSIGQTSEVDLRISECSGRAPFDKLHRLCSASEFSRVFAPPCASGTRWSAWKDIGSSDGRS